MTERELEILLIIKENPLISQDELAYLLGITRSGVAAHIHNLMRKGYIKGKGYVINESNFISVIGGINIDIMGIPSGSLIRNNSNPGKIYFSLGGAGRNIALSLTKFNIPNYLISVYGDDTNGVKFFNDSKENNLNIQCCEKIFDERTSTFLYIDDATGSKVLGIDDMEIFNKMTPKFIERFLDRINSSQYCVVDTNIPSETIKYIYNVVTVPIIVKTVSVNKNVNLIHDHQNIHLLVTSPSELKELLTHYDEPFINLNQAVNFMLEKNISNIIVFSVKTGLYFKNKIETISIKKNPKRIININGASASLISSVIWGLQNSLDWNRILKISYASIFLALKSKEPVNPILSVSEMLKEEKEIFQST